LTVAAVSFLTLGALAAVKGLRAAAQPSAAPQARVADAPRRDRLAKAFRLERAGKSSEAREPTTLSLAPGEQVALLIDDHETQFIGPGVLSVARGRNGSWGAQFEPRGWRAQLERGPSSVSGLPSASVMEKPRTEQQSLQSAKAPDPSGKSGSSPRGLASSDDPAGLWRDAAAALRTGDHAGADEALVALGRSGDASTREAALLARAELDLGAGVRERALSLLATLAETAETPFVRQRARQILETQR
jgi:hypothetical protein